MEKIIYFFKKYKKSSICFFIFLIIIIPITLSNVFIDKNSLSIVLNYYGMMLSGLLGGALTLFGVWWSIFHEKRMRYLDSYELEKKRTEELALQYKPILTLKLVNRSFLPQNIGLEIQFVIKNDGRGEAEDIQISISATNFIAIAKNQVSSLIPKDEKSYLTVYACHYSEQKGSSQAIVPPISIDDNLTFDLTIKYADAFNKSYYYETIASIIIEGTYLMNSSISNSVKELIKNTPKHITIRISNITYKKVSKKLK